MFGIVNCIGNSTQLEQEYLSELSSPTDILHKSSRHKILSMWKIVGYQ